MSQTVLKEKPDLRKKLGEVPHRPGVYAMRDRLNRIVYVGKARDLRQRLANYFLPSGHARADLKTRALLDTVWDFEWHVVRSEPEAVLLEGQLIKDYRPRYNITMRDDKRFLLVKVNLGDPFPRFQLTRLRKDDGARYFGPFAHSGALRTTIELIRKRFGIRACRPLAAMRETLPASWLRADSLTPSLSVINTIQDALTSANAFAPGTRPSAVRLSVVTVATMRKPPMTSSSISSLTAPARTDFTVPANWLRALVLMAMLSISE